MVFDHAVLENFARKFMKFAPFCRTGSAARQPLQTMVDELFTKFALVSGKGMRLAVKLVDLPKDHLQQQPTAKAEKNVHANRIGDHSQKNVGTLGWVAA